MSPVQLTEAVRTGRLISDGEFTRGQDRDLGAFYAPFDWINDEADVVLLGITPGMQQAEAALVAARSALLGGRSVAQAAHDAKSEASFKGEMRLIAATLMDHFGLHRLFDLPSCSDLFGAAARRVHYTSVFRFPVLRVQNGKWRNYSGTSWANSKLLRATVEEHLIPELTTLRQAWLIPFGPIPSEVLDGLGRRGVIDPAKVLSGLNHPSGTQWNRHNCQLDRADHQACAPNVGCKTIQARSEALRARVRCALAA